MSEAVRVLLVEDNPMDVEIVARTLSKNPYIKCALEIAQTSEEAIEKVQKENFDIILCDFNLPGMTGLEMLRKFNENKIVIPVVIVSSQRDQKIAAQIIKEGAYDYVAKEDGYSTALPFVIQDTLSRFRFRQERERLEREILQKNADLEKINQDLNRLNQLKSNFLSVASHELRTPLAIVQETCSLILEERIGVLNDKQRMFLENIKTQTDRLLRTVTDLLDLTKIEAGKLELHKTFVEVADWAERIIAFFQVHAREKKIQLISRITALLGQIYMDEDKMIQVLTNFLGNAIKFTPEGGTITISVLDKEDQIEVKINDTGIGIPTEDIPKIFNRFQQAEHQESVYLQKGTGLGLVIAKEIVNMHQGEVGVSSQTGVGSTFWFRLPRLSLDEVAIDMISHAIKRGQEREQSISLCLIEQSGTSQPLFSKEILSELELRLVPVLRREKDQLCKYKGCLVVVMRETDFSGAKVAFERIENLLKDLQRDSEKFHTVIFATAMATYPDHGKQAEDLLNFCMQNVHPVSVSL